MRELKRKVVRVAPLTASVLIVGESGTGKDVVARAIHRLSGRRGRYVPLNSGALSQHLVDSELFGHQRGAFTGALQARVGAFESASEGTLFLDEVADTPADIQVKLLRAVESGEIRALGSNVVKRVQTRVVAATWAPLEQRIAEGRFRADLYHRLATFVLRVPPLRQRKADIPVLARLQLRRVSEELGPRQLSPAAVRRLGDYHYPGNVRELFGIVYRAAAWATTSLVDADDIERALPEQSGVAPAPAACNALAILEANNGNVSAAARHARVPRSTFRSWLKRAGPRRAGGSPDGDLERHVQHQPLVKAV